MELNNIKKTELIRIFFDKEILIYATHLRNAKDDFIEKIYNEILQEEWMKVVDNKLEPLNLYEKIYLICEANTLEDLMETLIFKKNSRFNEDGSPKSYNVLLDYIIDIKGGEGYLSVDYFEDYLVNKYGTEFDKLVHEEIEKVKKTDPGEVEDGVLSSTGYYYVVSNIIDNPMYNYKKHNIYIDAYGSMKRWLSETTLDKERLFKHFGLDTVKLRESVHTVFFKTKV